MPKGATVAHVRFWDQTPTSIIFRKKIVAYWGYTRLEFLKSTEELESKSAVRSQDDVSLLQHQERYRSNKSPKLGHLTSNCHPFRRTKQSPQKDWTHQGHELTVSEASGVHLQASYNILPVTSSQVGICPAFSSYRGDFRHLYNGQTTWPNGEDRALMREGVGGIKCGIFSHLICSLICPRQTHGSHPVICYLMAYNCGITSTT